MEGKRSLRWLIGRSRTAVPWMVLSVGLGLAGGLLLIVQAGVLARIIHGATMTGQGRDDFWPLLVVLAAVAAAKAVLAWGREVAGFKTGAKIRSQVRLDLMRHLAHLGPTYTSAQKSGALTSTVMEQVEALHGFFAHYLPQLALAVAIPIAIVAFVFPISWAVAGLFLLTAPLIPFFMILIGMGAQSISQRYFVVLSRMSGHFLDVLQGLTTLKLFDRADDEAQRVGAVAGAYRKQTMKVLRVAFLSSAVLEFFSSVAIAVVAVYLGMRFLGFYGFGAWGRTLTLADGLFILLLAPEFYLPLRELGVHYHTRAEAVGATQEILKVLDLPAPSGRDLKIEAAQIDLRFENVHLSYQDGQRPALRGISFALPAGQRLAVVGQSGAGKTSLMQLVLGFASPDRGAVEANGVAVWRLAPEHWRNRLAWIGQDAMLFGGTIRDNIRMGRPDASAAEIEVAARSANVLEFTSLLPDGLDTKIGERGIGLSRGQAQRLALARAYLKDAPILLLDEPTAGLDRQGEALVLEALDRLARDRTVLMLTHRLRGLKTSDRILVMDQGKIVETGSFDQLVAVDGAFARLYAKSRGHHG